MFLSSRVTRYFYISLHLRCTGRVSLLYDRIAGDALVPASRVARAGALADQASLLQLLFGSLSETDMPSDPPFAGWARISNVKPADPLNLGRNQHLREILESDALSAEYACWVGLKPSMVV